MQAFGGFCLRLAFMAASLAFGLLMAAAAALAAASFLATTACGPLYHFNRESKYQVVGLAVLQTRTR